MNNLAQDQEYEQIILELYKILGTAKAVADDLDIHILDVYAVLKTHKLSIEDRMQMAASDTSVLGAMGENLFKKLVPGAVEVNAVINANPEFDFVVGDLTIDVKTSNILKRKVSNKSKTVSIIDMWLWKLKQPWHTKYGADFYVLFGLHGEKNDFSAGYDCYVIPSELLDGVKKVEIRKHLRDTCKWSDFLIEPEKIAPFFQKIKDSQTPLRQVFNETFLEKENRDFYQVEVSELQNLTRKIKREVKAHA